MRHKHAEIVEVPNPVKRQPTATHDATHDTRNQLRSRRSFASKTVATSCEDVEASLRQQSQLKKEGRPTGIEPATAETTIRCSTN